MSKVIAPPHGWRLLDDARLRRHRAVEPDERLRGGLAHAAGGGRVPARPDARADRPAGPPPRDLGPALPAPPRAGDRRPRRPPAGHPDARVGALADAQRAVLRVAADPRAAPSPPAREPAADRDAVNDALREGRCYLSFEALAPGRGFRFWAEADGAAAPMGARRTGPLDPAGGGATAGAAAAAARWRARARGRGRPAGAEVEEDGCYRSRHGCPATSGSGCGW